MDYKAEIDSRYLLLSTNITSTRKKAILNDIMQLKEASGFLFRNYKQTLYLDVKYYFKEYISCLLDKNNNYDVINFGDVRAKVDLLKGDEKINALKCLERELRKDFRDSEFQTCGVIRKKIELNYYFSLLDFSIAGGNAFFKLILLLSTYNVLSILLSIFSLVLFYAIITFPLQGFPIKLFKIYSFNYSNNPILNHFCNSVAVIFDLNGDSKVVPFNFWAVICLLTLKFIFIVIIGEYLITELQKRTSLD